jgi:hypothetical protein
VLDQDLTAPYKLDGDGDLQACEDLPGNEQYDAPDQVPDFHPDREDSRRKPHRSACPSSSPDSPPAGGDIDCDEVDGPIWVGPDDPNNLDGDNDGLACE